MAITATTAEGKIRMIEHRVTEISQRKDSAMAVKKTKPASKLRKKTKSAKEAVRRINKGSARKSAPRKSVARTPRSRKSGIKKKSRRVPIRIETESVATPEPSVEVIEVVEEVYEEPLVVTENEELS